MRIRSSPGTKTINLQHLIELLKSRDEALWIEYAWQFDGETRFLDGQPNIGNKVAFASWPRSGNSFLRRYLELMTGIVTGSDNTLHTNVILQLQGMKGENITDDTVWIAKTHSPWCMYDAQVFHCNKMIVIIRNPLDTFISWLNLIAQCNHNTEAPFEYELAYPKLWNWWIRDIAPSMTRWYKVIMDDAKLNRVPVLFIRFEDLVVDP